MKLQPGIIRIIIAEDHRLVRESLVSLVNAARECDVIGTAGDGNELLALLRTRQPNIVLLDIRMPRMNGFEVIRRIVEEKPWIRIIVLSMYSQPAYIKEMLRCGAHGFVSKYSMSDELHEAIRRVHSGGTYLSKSIQDLVIQDFAGKSFENGSGVPKLLSPREIKIIQMLSNGYSAREIAEKLSINEKTVERNKTEILKKLNVRNTAQMVKAAIDNGLLIM
jgi:DNA-binding NarL/FixJ family response regulator